MTFCGRCGADWTAGQFEPNCAECGGGALKIPCPVCGGHCGAFWKRAVQDSNDSGVAHFFGQCQLEKH